LTWGHRRIIDAIAWISDRSDVSSFTRSMIFWTAEITVVWCLPPNVRARSAVRVRRRPVTNRISWLRAAPSPPADSSDLRELRSLPLHHRAAVISPGVADLPVSDAFSSEAPVTGLAGLKI
jgi:hypothetical protein